MMKVGAELIATKADLAVLLNVGVQTVANLVREGKIPGPDGCIGGTDVWHTKKYRAIVAKKDALERERMAGRGKGGVVTAQKRLQRLAAS
jgi:hypothetical protein